MTDWITPALPEGHSREDTGTVRDDAPPFFAQGVVKVDNLPGFTAPTPTLPV
jgi:hypothetical protein